MDCKPNKRFEKSGYVIQDGCLLKSYSWRVVKWQTKFTKVFLYAVTRRCQGTRWKLSPWACLVTAHHSGHLLPPLIMAVSRCTARLDNYAISAALCLIAAVSSLHLVSPWWWCCVPRLPRRLHHTDDTHHGTCNDIYICHSHHRPPYQLAALTGKFYHHKYK